MIFKPLGSILRALMERSNNQINWAFPYVSSPKPNTIFK